MTYLKVNKMKQGLKITALLLATFFLHVGEAQAQRQGGRQGRGGAALDSIDVVQMVKKLSAELALTEVQVADLTNISQSHFDAMRAEQKAEKISRIEKKEAHEAAKADYEANIKALLTAEQQVQYEEILKSRKDRRKGKGKRKRRGAKKDASDEGGN